LLGNVLARQLSVEAGAVETILLRDGHVTEASASNVFVGRNGKGSAPPRDNPILIGITHHLLVGPPPDRPLGFQVRRISEAELRTADEIWLSSSSKEVLAVTTLDGKPVGSGKPGPLFRRMHAAYQEHKSKVTANRAVAA